MYMDASEMNFNIMPHFSVDFKYQTQVSAQFRQTVSFERILDGTNCDFITPCDIVSFSKTSLYPHIRASNEACDTYYPLNGRIQ